MGMVERLYQIDQMLTSRSFVTKTELMERLGVSWATLKRDLTYLKDRLNAPITFDRDLGGYRFESKDANVGKQYELPGLWFSAEEIYALMAMQQLLRDLDKGGLLGPHIDPLLVRLRSMLSSADSSADEIQKRVRIDTIGARKFGFTHFQSLGAAVLRRKRLILDYYARGTDESSKREVSPQALRYYRDNWYLDAWCHMREGLRTFAVDSIRQVETLEAPAKDVSEQQIRDVMQSGFGIFFGQETQWAELVFNAKRSRWVSTEQWHPQQQGNFLDDGRYQLRIPYTDDRELIGEILRCVGDCEVVAPKALREKVAEVAAIVCTTHKM